MQRLHLYTIIILITIALPASALAANAATVPLSWRDTGYDLANGYRHTITLTAHYRRFPPVIDGGQAWIQAGPLKASLTVVQDFIGFHYKFEIKVNDETVYTDTAGVHWGSGEVSFAFQVEIDCNGNAIVYVDGQQVGAFQINTVTDILKNTDGDASVTVTATRMQSCNSNGGGSGGGSVNPPPGPSTGLAAGIADAFSSASRALLTIVIAVVLIVVVLIILAKQGGAKKLARKAMG